MEACGNLRQIFYDFVEWLANERSPWAAYQDLLYVRLIGLYKNTGVLLVVMGETWLRLVANCILKVISQYLKDACSTDQLCGGMEANFEGGIHEIHLLRYKKNPEGGLGLPLH